MASAKYKYFINLNKAPINASKIGVYNSSGERVGGITIPQSSKIDLDSLGEKQYTFGCVSDIHLQDDTAMDDFKKALTYFNENENVDFTCICGDLTKKGLESELQDFKEYVETYSPNTPVYAISGNHEGFNSDILSILEKYTGRPLYYSMNYKDDVFVFCGVKASKEGELFTTEELQWLYETLEENRNKRVFLFQHVRPQDTSGNAYQIYSYDIWGGNEQIIFESLVKHYRNVILFHGHSHLKFYLQYGVSTANIDTDLGMYSIHIPSLAVPRDGDITGANSKVALYAESEGYVIDVYEKGIVLRGRDFVSGKFIPIATYQLDTNLKTISPNGYVDSTGTLNTGDAFGVNSPITVSVGNTKTLSVITNISSYSVTYSSSDEEVATVNSNGVVTGVSEGKCIITLTENKTGMTAQCEVTVLVESTEKVVEIYSYSGTQTFAELGDGINESITLPKGKKLYAKWDNATYSGGTLDEATTQKVGIAGLTASKGLLTSDYQNFSNETLLTEGLSEDATFNLYFKCSSSSTAELPVTMTLDNFRIYYYDDGSSSGGGDDTNTNVMSISDTFTFSEISDTQYDERYNVTAGKKLYAKWDGMTYNGSNSVTEKVGILVSAYNSSGTKLGTVTDYQDYSNEIELVDKTDGITNLGTLSDISYIRVWAKSSSSSTATFPVTMALNNFRVYTKD